MKWKLKIASLVLAFMFGFAGIIPVKIAIAFNQVPVPQAILVLGGDNNRMEFAAQFWQLHRNLDIWISDSKSYLNNDRLIFQRFGVHNRLLRLDGISTDTVTNFTSVVDKFTERKLQHIYLITSDYHMRRSIAIASIVLGSQGIVVTPIAVPSSGEKSESLLRVMGDCGRCILWIFTNRTGASFNPHIKEITFLYK
jgi:hypothetical protein